MKTFWSAVAIFLICDAMLYSSGHNSFVWANEPAIAQWVSNVVHYVGTQVKKDQQ
jgi:hypothetical protein